jgi:hypothetical protein
MMYSRAMETWLLFAYQLPASPSTHRSYTWRKLKAAGALYLQNSVCLLPDREGLRAQLRELLAEIAERGGSARLIPMAVKDKAEEGRLVADFLAQIDDDYGEFLEKCGDLHAELAKERIKGHLTWGELEENEAELVKLRAWLPRLEGRDWFASPKGGEARRGLAACEEDFRTFEAEVEAHSARA